MFMTLKEIKKIVAEGSYDYSKKIRESIEEGFFDEKDLEHCIVSAAKVHKKERDELKQAIHGMKYVILGKDTHGQLFYTVGKVMDGPQGRLYYFITARQADQTP